MKAKIDDGVLVLIPETEQEQNDADLWFRYIHAISDPEEEICCEIETAEKL